MTELDLDAMPPWRVVEPERTSPLVVAVVLLVGALACWGVIYLLGLLLALL